MRKIHVISLGCPKNLVDTEKILAGSFRDFTMSSQPESADVILINTCSFILPAKEESLETILEFVEWKKKYPEKRIVVTGCLWEQHREELEKEIPEVEYLSNKEVFLSSNRLLTTQSFAYLKIAEGCSRRCSFCTIPIFKGNHQSRAMEDILEEAQALEGRVQELIIVSQDTSYYGTDLYGKPSLLSLLKRLSDMDFPRIRILYFYPQNVNKEIIELIARKPNICKYLDLPLQHLSRSILKSMNRWGDYETYKRILFGVRERVPEIAIRSSFIVGFPGETEKDFEFLLKGMEELQLNRAGFFVYSDEEQAPSALLESKVPEEIKEERFSRAVFIQEEISEELLQKRIGKTEKILIENFDEKIGLYIGRSEFEAPEIDGIVYVKSDQPIKVGQMIDVKIENNDQHNLWGTAAT